MQFLVSCKNKPITNINGMEKVFSTCVQQVGWCFGLFYSNVAQTPIDVSGISF